MKTVLFFIPLFFILSLLQTSFVAHFTIEGLSVPLVVLSVSLVSLFASSSSAGLAGAFVGGILLDVFSQQFFGYWTCILVFLSLVITFMMNTYVRFPILKRN